MRERSSSDWRLRNSHVDCAEKLRAADQGVSLAGLRADRE
jgi:hypothetical protein